MGLFDWLNDAMGSEAGIGGGGGSNMPTMKPPDLGPPPVQPMDTTPPGPTPVQPADMVTGPGSEQPRPSPAPPPIPLPQPRPAAADAGAPAPAGLPPPSAGMPPAGPPAGPPMQIAPSAAPPLEPQSPADSGGPISRALGLDPNRTKSMFGGLGAGLTAAGNSAGKSPFQALTSGAGATLEGSEKTEDKTYDQKIKYLQAAVAAQSAGDKAAYNKNYASYLAGKLKADTDKAASDGAGSGKKGAWNKPDSQKFIDAQHALASDPEVKASQKLLEQAAKSMEPADIAKAQAAHAALIKDKEAKYLAGVGLDPQKTMDLAKNPPGSPNNPHVVTSQSDFDTYVKPGQAYRNPRDGKVYIRKGGEAPKGGDSGAPEPAAASAPAAPGPPPNPMGGTTAADDEE